MDENEADSERPPPLKRGPGVTYNVPVSNAFDVLMDREGKRKISNTNSQGTSIYEEPDAPRAKPPPPITIPLTHAENNEIKPDPSNIRQTLDSVSKEYDCKHTQQGIQIFTKNSAIHDALLKTLKETGTAHWSHPVHNKKQKRFVLYGLDKQDTNDIIEGLAEVNVYPIKVDYMFTKSPRFANQCHYIIHLKHDTPITLSQLKEIRAVNRTVVKWAHYSPKKSTVGCCRNCCQFGHGSRGCGMPPKCIICAENHHFLKCKFLLKKHEGGHDRIHQKHIHCAGCGGNHTATFKDCPKRLKYITESNGKRKQPQQKRSSQEVNITRPIPPKMNEINYPVFVNPAYQNQTQPPAEWPTGLNTQSNSQQPTNDLYTMEECKAMMDQLFTSLQSCNNKYQQAKVIADYSFKYFVKF